MNVAELVDKHFDTWGKIHEYFGFAESWRVLPLDDMREWFWSQRDERIVWAETSTALRYGMWNDGTLDEDDLTDTERKTFPRYSESSQAPSYYSGSLYSYHHQNDHVCRRPDLTLVLVDTHTDGNVLAMIFDSTKEL